MTWLRDEMTAADGTQFSMASREMKNGRLRIGHSFAGHYWDRRQNVESVPVEFIKDARF